VVNDYNEFWDRFNRETPESLDGIIARLSLYPQDAMASVYAELEKKDIRLLARKNLSPLVLDLFRERNDRLRYLPLARALKPGGILIRMIYEHEATSIAQLTDRQIRSYGFEKVRPQEIGDRFVYRFPEVDSEQELEVLILRKRPDADLGQILAEEPQVEIDLPAAEGVERRGFTVQELIAFVRENPSLEFERGKGGRWHGMPRREKAASMGSADASKGEEAVRASLGGSRGEREEDKARREKYERVLREIGFSRRLAGMLEKSPSELERDEIIILQAVLESANPLARIIQPGKIKPGNHLVVFEMPGQGTDGLGLKRLNEILGYALSDVMIARRRVTLWDVMGKTFGERVQPVYDTYKENVYVISGEVTREELATVRTRLKTAMSHQLKTDPIFRKALDEKRDALARYGVANIDDAEYLFDISFGVARVDNDTPEKLLTADINAHQAVTLFGDEYDMPRSFYREAYELMILDLADRGRKLEEELPAIFRPERGETVLREEAVNILRKQTAWDDLTDELRREGETLFRDRSGYAQAQEYFNLLRIQDYIKKWDMDFEKASEEALRIRRLHHRLNEWHADPAVMDQTQWDEMRQELDRYLLREPKNRLETGRHLFNAQVPLMKHPVYVSLDVKNMGFMNAVEFQLEVKKIKTLLDKKNALPKLDFEGREAVWQEINGIWMKAADGVTGKITRMQAVIRDARDRALEKAGIRPEDQEYLSLLGGDEYLIALDGDVFQGEVLDEFLFAIRDRVQVEAGLEVRIGGTTVINEARERFAAKEREAPNDLAHADAIFFNDENTDILKKLEALQTKGKLPAAYESAPVIRERAADGKIIWSGLVKAEGGQVTRFDPMTVIRKAENVPSLEETAPEQASSLGLSAEDVERLVREQGRKMISAALNHQFNNHLNPLTTSLYKWRHSPRPEVKADAVRRIKNNSAIALQVLGELSRGRDGEFYIADYTGSGYLVRTPSVQGYTPENQGTKITDPALIDELYRQSDLLSIVNVLKPFFQALHARAEALEQSGVPEAVDEELERTYKILELEYQTIAAQFDKADLEEAVRHGERPDPYRIAQVLARLPERERIFGHSLRLRAGQPDEKEFQVAYSFRGAGEEGNAFQIEISHEQHQSSVGLIFYPEKRQIYIEGAHMGDLARTGLRYYPDILSVFLRDVERVESQVRNEETRRDLFAFTNSHRNMEIPDLVIRGTLIAERRGEDFAHSYSTRGNRLLSIRVPWPELRQVLNEAAQAENLEKPEKLRELVQKLEAAPALYARLPYWEHNPELATILNIEKVYLTSLLENTGRLQRLLAVLPQMYRTVSDREARIAASEGPPEKVSSMGMQETTATGETLSANGSLRGASLGAQIEFSRVGTESFAKIRTEFQADDPEIQGVGNYLRGEGTEIMIVWEQGEPVGFTTFQDHAQEGFLKQLLFYVFKGHRGRRVGTFLISELAREAVKRGRKKLTSTSLTEGAELGNDGKAAWERAITQLWSESLKGVPVIQKGSTTAPASAPGVITIQTMQDDSSFVNLDLALLPLNWPVPSLGPRRTEAQEQPKPATGESLGREALWQEFHGLMDPANKDYFRRSSYSLAGGSRHPFKPRVFIDKPGDSGKATAEVVETLFPRTLLRLVIAEAKKKEDRLRPGVSIGIPKGEQYNPWNNNLGIGEYPITFPHEIGHWVLARRLLQPGENIDLARFWEGHFGSAENPGVVRLSLNSEDNPALLRRYQELVGAVSAQKMTDAPLGWGNSLNEHFAHNVERLVYGAPFLIGEKSKATTEDFLTFFQDIGIIDAQEVEDYRVLSSKLNAKGVPFQPVKVKQSLHVADLLVFRAYFAKQVMERESELGRLLALEEEIALRLEEDVEDVKQWLAGDPEKLIGYLKLKFAGSPQLENRIREARGEASSLGSEAGASLGETGVGRREFLRKAGIVAALGAGIGAPLAWELWRERAPGEITEAEMLEETRRRLLSVSSPELQRVYGRVYDAIDRGLIPPIDFADAEVAHYNPDTRQVMIPRSRYAGLGTNAEKLEAVLRSVAHELVHAYFDLIRREGRPEGRIGRADEERLAVEAAYWAAEGSIMMIEVDEQSRPSRFAYARRIEPGREEFELSTNLPENELEAFLRRAASARHVVPEIPRILSSLIQGLRNDVSFRVIRDADPTAFLESSLYRATVLAQAGVSRTAGASLGEKARFERSFLADPSLEQYDRIPAAVRDSLRSRFTRALVHAPFYLRALNFIVDLIIRLQTGWRRTEPLTITAKVEYQTEAARRNIRFLNQRYPDGWRIVSVGSSPAWIVRVMQLIGQMESPASYDPSRYEYLPYSGGGLNARLPSKEEALALRPYLKRKGLDPQTIVNRKEVTILMDYVQVGALFSSLIRIMEAWAKETLSPEDLIRFYQKLAVHTFFAPGLGMETLDVSFEPFRQTGYRESLERESFENGHFLFAHSLVYAENYFQDRRTGWNPPGRWSSLNDDAIAKLEKLSKRAAMEDFLLIDHLRASQGLRTAASLGSEIRQVPPEWAQLPELASIKARDEQLVELAGPLLERTARRLFELGPMEGTALKKAQIELADDWLASVKELGLRRLAEDQHTAVRAIVSSPAHSLNARKGAATYLVRLVEVTRRLKEHTMKIFANVAGEKEIQKELETTRFLFFSRESRYENPWDIRQAYFQARQTLRDLQNQRWNGRVQGWGGSLGTALPVEVGTKEVEEALAKAIQNVEVEFPSYEARKRVGRPSVQPGMTLTGFVLPEAEDGEFLSYVQESLDQGNTAVVWKSLLARLLEEMMTAALRERKGRKKAKEVEIKIGMAEGNLRMDMEDGRKDPLAAALNAEETRLLASGVARLGGKQSQAGSAMRFALPARPERFQTLEEGQVSVATRSGAAVSISLGWDHPTAESLHETLLALDAFPTRDELRARILTGARRAPPDLDRALDELYHDPTEAILFDPSVNPRLQDTLRSLIRNKRNNFVGPARAILVRKAVPGETDTGEPRVQLMGSRLIVTLFPRDLRSRDAAARALEKTLPRLRREMAQAVKENRTVLGVDSDAVEAFLQNRFHPFLVRSEGIRTAHMPEARKRVLETKLREIPLGSGLFARHLRITLPRAMDAQDAILHLRTELNRLVFLPAGYYAHPLNVAKILGVEQRLALGTPLRTYYYDSLEGHAGGFALSGRAFVEVGRGFRRMRRAEKKEARRLVSTLQQGITFAKGFDPLVKRLLRHLSVPRDYTRVVNESERNEEEFHARHKIFSAFLHGKPVEQPSLRETSTSLLRLGSYLFPAMAVERSELLKVFQSEEGVDVLMAHGLSELPATLSRLIQSRDRTWELLLYLAHAERESQDESHVVLFPFIMGRFQEEGTRLYGNRARFLAALARDPDAVLETVFTALHRAAFYNEEEQERILNAKPGMERANVLLDLATPGGTIDSGQVGLLAAQAGLDLASAAALLRERRDFVEREGVFSKAERGASLGAIGGFDAARARREARYGTRFIGMLQGGPAAEVARYGILSRDLGKWLGMLESEIPVAMAASLGSFVTGMPGRPHLKGYLKLIGDLKRGADAAVEDLTIEILRMLPALEGAPEPVVGEIWQIVERVHARGDTAKSLGAQGVRTVLPYGGTRTFQLDANRPYLVRLNGVDFTFRMASEGLILKRQGTEDGPYTIPSRSGAKYKVPGAVDIHVSYRNGRAAITNLSREPLGLQVLERVFNQADAAALQRFRQGASRYRIGEQIEDTHVSTLWRLALRGTTRSFVLKQDKTDWYAENDRRVAEALEEAIVKRDDGWYAPIEILPGVWNESQDLRVRGLVMPLMEGETAFERYVQHPAPVSSVVFRGEYLEVAESMADAILFVHDLGFVHGDVKPGSFWIPRGSKRARLFDFNLALPISAKRTDAPAVGTLGQVSREQLEDRSAWPKNDLFSFAATLAWMWGGRAFWEAAGADLQNKNQYGILAEKDFAPALRGNPLAGVIRKGLRQQYADMRAMARDIGRELEKHRARERGARGSSLGQSPEGRRKRQEEWTLDQWARSIAAAATRIRSRMEDTERVIPAKDLAVEMDKEAVEDPNYDPSLRRWVPLSYLRQMIREINATRPDLDLSPYKIQLVEPRTPRVPKVPKWQKQEEWTLDQWADSIAAAATRIRNRLADPDQEIPVKDLAEEMQREAQDEPGYAPVLKRKVDVSYLRKILREISESRPDIDLSPHKIRIGQARARWDTAMWKQVVREAVREEVKAGRVPSPANVAAAIARKYPEDPPRGRKGFTGENLRQIEADKKRQLNMKQAQGKNVKEGDEFDLRSLGVEFEDQNEPWTEAGLVEDVRAAVAYLDEIRKVALDAPSKPLYTTRAVADAINKTRELRGLPPRDVRPSDLTGSAATYEVNLRDLRVDIRGASPRWPAEVWIRRIVAAVEFIRGIAAEAEIDIEITTTRVAFLMTRFLVEEAMAGKPIPEGFQEITAMKLLAFEHKRLAPGHQSEAAGGRVIHSLADLGIAKRETAPAWTPQQLNWAVDLAILEVEGKRIEAAEKRKITGREKDIFYETPPIRPTDLTDVLSDPAFYRKHPDLGPVRTYTLSQLLQAVRYGMNAAGIRSLNERGVTMRGSVYEAASKDDVDEKTKTLKEPKDWKEIDPGRAAEEEDWFAHFLGYFTPEQRELLIGFREGKIGLLRLETVPPGETKEEKEIRLHRLEQWNKMKVIITYFLSEHMEMDNEAIAKLLAAGMSEDSGASLGDDFSEAEKAFFADEQAMFGVNGPQAERFLQVQKRINPERRDWVIFMPGGVHRFVQGILATNAKEVVIVDPQESLEFQLSRIREVGAVPAREPVWEEERAVLEVLGDEEAAYRGSTLGRLEPEAVEGEDPKEFRIKVALAYIKALGGVSPVVSPDGMRIEFSRRKLTLEFDYRGKRRRLVQYLWDAFDPSFWPAELSQGYDAYLELWLRFSTASPRGYWDVLNAKVLAGLRPGGAVLMDSSYRVLMGTDFPGMRPLLETVLAYEALPSPYGDDTVFRTGSEPVYVARQPEERYDPAIVQQVSELAKDAGWIVMARDAEGYFASTSVTVVDGSVNIDPAYLGEEARHVKESFAAIAKKLEGLPAHLRERAVAWFRAYLEKPVLETKVYHVTDENYRTLNAKRLQYTGRPEHEEKRLRDLAVVQALNQAVEKMYRDAFEATVLVPPAQKMGESAPSPAAAVETEIASSETVTDLGASLGISEDPLKYVLSKLGLERETEKLLQAFKAGEPAVRESRLAAFREALRREARREIFTDLQGEATRDVSGALNALRKTADFLSAVHSPEFEAEITGLVDRWSAKGLVSHDDKEALVQEIVSSIRDIVRGESTFTMGLSLLESAHATSDEQIDAFMRELGRAFEAFSETRGDRKINLALSYEESDADAVLDTLDAALKELVDMLVIFHERGQNLNASRLQAYRFIPQLIDPRDPRKTGRAVEKARGLVGGDLAFLGADSRIPGEVLQGLASVFADIGQLPEKLKKPFLLSAAAVLLALALLDDPERARVLASQESFDTFLGSHEQFGMLSGGFELGPGGVVRAQVARLVAIVQAAKAVALAA
jgi:serine/threonine protein kinase